MKGYALLLAGPSVFLTGCDDRADRSGVAVDGAGAPLAAVDTPPTFPRRGPGPGPHHPMDGIGPAVSLDDWTRHMAVMRGLTGHDLQSMVGRHRELAGRMLDELDIMWNRTARPSTPTRLALRDSLYRDLELMRQMGPERLEPFVHAHDARMRRYLRIHQVNR